MEFLFPFAMNAPVYLLGGARTDFKRNLKKENKTLRDVIVEVARAALTSIGLEAADIQAGIVGNFAGGMFTRQLHIGALLLEADDALRGIPTMHVEAACASGSLAVLTAAQWIAAGLHDCVLVLGAEQQKTMSPADGSDVLGAAADYHREKPEYGEFMFPKLFGRIAEVYMQRYPALTEHDLARVAVKNYLHAHLNPLAQMRDTDLDFATASTESQKNWRIAASPLKLYDCSQITDGAAAVVLCSERFLDKLGHRTSGDKPPALPVTLMGWGHSTDCLALEKKDVPHFPAGPSRLGPRDGNGGHPRSAHRTARRRGPRLFLGQRDHRLRDHRPRCRTGQKATLFCTMARRCSLPSARKSSAPTPRRRPSPYRSIPAAV